MATPPYANVVPNLDGRKLFVVLAQHEDVDGVNSTNTRPKTPARGQYTRIGSTSTTQGNQQRVHTGITTRASRPIEQRASVARRSNRRIGTRAAGNRGPSRGLKQSNRKCADRVAHTRGHLPDPPRPEFAATAPQHPQATIFHVALSHRGPERSEAICVKPTALRGVRRGAGGRPHPRPPHALNALPRARR